MATLLPTSLVGSYPQPDWLIDRAKLAGRFPPRVRATELWRVAPEWLEQAMDDATLLAIRDQERAGLDIITDGEMRRESYSNRFATALDGVDLDNPGIALDRSGEPNPVPRVTGKISRRHAVETRDVEFLRANTDRPIKITVPGPFTMAQQAQDDATLLAIREQERAGLDIVTDGEMRRESYSNRFATALDGVDLDNPGIALDRSGEPNPVPRVVGKISRRHPVEVRDVLFLRANTDRRIKITVPGPFTMSQQAQNDHYADEGELAHDYAVAVNAEIRDLFAAGADYVQIDEPYMQARPEKARAFGLDAVRTALAGVEGKTALHICFGYAAIIHERPNGYNFLPELADTAVKAVSIETAQSKLDCSVLAKLEGKTVILGVLDLSTPEIETPEIVAGRIRRALPYVAPEKLVIAPDCGLKYLPREVAFGKMKAMADGAAIVRAEH